MQMAFLQEVGSDDRRGAIQLIRQKQLNVIDNEDLNQPLRQQSLAWEP
jgi:hypothetical protein